MEPTVHHMKIYNDIRNKIDKVFKTNIANEYLSVIENLHSHHNKTPTNIDQSFYWADKPQGHAFWKLADRLLNHMRSQEE